MQLMKLKTTTATATTVEVSAVTLVANNHVNLKENAIVICQQKKKHKKINETKKIFNFSSK